MLIDLTGIKYLGSPQTFVTVPCFIQGTVFFGGCGVIEAVLTPL